VLRVGNASLLRGISAAIGKNWDIIDNSFIYAEMIYFATIIDEYNYINVVPVVNPFPAGDHPVWVDLDAAQPDIMAILNSVDMGRIILVQEVDYDPVDLQLIYWMAKGGIKIDGPDAPNAHVFENSHVNWPAVPITILGHGPAPGEPPPQLRSGSNILSFVLNLATRRNEWADLHKAVYIVLDRIGLRYNNLHGQYYPRSSNQPLIPKFEVI
jgi:hypothetical protein